MIRLVSKNGKRRMADVELQQQLAGIGEAQEVICATLSENP